MQSAREALRKEKSGVDLSRGAQRLFLYTYSGKRCPCRKQGGAQLLVAVPSASLSKMVG